MKNDYKVEGDRVIIFLNSPKYGAQQAVVSLNQLDRVKEFPNTWYAAFSEKTQSFYVAGNMTVGKNKRRVVMMHRWIIGPHLEGEIDHVNHDTLDNTDNNLRLLTSAQNKQNRRGANRNSRTGVRGVSYDEHRDVWTVRMKIDKKDGNYGTYKTKEEAVEASKRVRKSHMPYSEDAV